MAVSAWFLWTLEQGYRRKSPLRPFHQRRRPAGLASFASKSQWSAQPVERARAKIFMDALWRACSNRLAGGLGSARAHEFLSPDPRRPAPATPRPPPLPDR